MSLIDVASTSPTDDDAAILAALAGKVDDSQVLTDVPAGVVFTDTVYTHPASHPISMITGLQAALDGKVDDGQVLTDVPAAPCSRTRCTRTPLATRSA